MDWYPSQMCCNVALGWSLSAANFSIGSVFLANMTVTVTPLLVLSPLHSANFILTKTEKTSVLKETLIENLGPYSPNSNCARINKTEIMELSYQIVHQMPDGFVTHKQNWNGNESDQLPAKSKRRLNIYSAEIMSWCCWKIANNS